MSFTPPPLLDKPLESGVRYPLDTQQDPLLQALRDPASVCGLTVEGWNTLLWRTRRCGLLGRLAFDLDALGLTERLLEGVRGRLEDARRAAAFNQMLRRHEAFLVTRALAGLDVPTVLLKGGAYLLADLPAARGRIAADLDLLVPRERLDEVEAAILSHGWAPVITDPYDQTYYRAWTHQIPPLRHSERATELDIHHTIAPLTGRARPNAAILFRDAVPLPGARLKVLCPTDMVIHSAIHLFNEEIALGLRDLLDLHDLLTHFGASAEFWAELPKRARLHGATRPLFYSLRYCERMLGTEVPASARDATAAFAPSPFVLTLMDRLVPLAIVPDGIASPRHGTGLARWLLYVRSHWLRMPPALLARHLAIKAVRRWRPKQLEHVTR